jgi:sacsin
MTFVSYRQRLKINNAVKSAFEDSAYHFDHSFAFGIEHRSDGESIIRKFVVHHTIQCDLMDKRSRAWAKEQKYIPWVAVAAQLPVNHYSGSP